MPKGIPCLTEIQKQEIIKRVTDEGSSRLKNSLNGYF